MAALTSTGCLQRQQRLRQLLAERGIDAAVLTDPRDIYYFSGVLLPRMLPACAVWLSAGRSWLVAPEAVAGAQVDELLTYASTQLGTTNPDLWSQLTAVVAELLRGGRAGLVLAWQGQSMPRLLGEAFEQAWRPDRWIEIDELLASMQRRKDADELEVLRAAIRANLAAYDAVQAAIVAGANELDVLAAGWHGATLAAGETVYHDGDYRCGELNGPARNRPIERGEMYIVDAWTCYRGYWSDLSRTFSVGGEPTPLQQSLFDHIAAVQRQAAGMLRPGVDGREVWRQLDQLIRQHPALAECGLVHHGGHCIGLRIHEMPDINRDRGGLLEPGNVVCVEPGGYTPAARYGARLENTFLITPAGAENLVDYPLNLIAAGG